VNSAPRHRPVFALTLARVRNFYREPSAVFWTFGFPILLSLALGVAFRNRPPEPVAVAIARGPGADAVLAKLTGRADVRPKLLDPGEAAQALRTGKVDLMVIPGEPRTYRFDPMRPESRLARSLVDDLLQRADGRRDATKVADHPVTEPGSRYIDFLLPGLIGSNLMSGSMWGIGYVIVEMRTRKLIKRLMATPMRKSTFLGSYLALRVLVLVVELPIMLLFARFAFAIDVHGSYALLTALAATGSLAFAGLGLLVASRATNTQTVGGLMNLVMLPMYICSGVFFSASHFPDSVQPVLRVLPLTALNDSLRSVMIDGAGVAQVARPALIMAAWGAISFAAALRLFRWR
jgi:ABC-type multidrug transport system permease subunit